MNRLAIAAIFMCTAAAVEAEPFDGAYVGGQAGWGSRSSELSTFAPTTDTDRSGIDYGAFAGYNVPIGASVVAGPEVEVGAGGKTLHGSGPADQPIIVDATWNYALTMRLGLTLGERVLVYGRAGYASERVRYRNEGPTPPVVGFPTSGSRWLDGLLIGGGAELALGARTTIRAEYRHRDAEQGFSAQQLLVGAALSF